MASGFKKTQTFGESQYPFGFYAYAPDFREKATNGVKHYPFEMRETSVPTFISAEMAANLNVSVSASFEINQAFFYDIIYFSNNLSESFCVFQRADGSVTYQIEEERTTLSAAGLAGLKQPIFLEGGVMSDFSSSSVGTQITLDFVYEDGILANRFGSSFNGFAANAPIVYILVKHESKSTVPRGQACLIETVSVRTQASLVSQFGAGGPPGDLYTVYILADFFSAYFLDRGLAAGVAGTGQKTTIGSLPPNQKAVVNAAEKTYVFMPFFNSIEKPFENFTADLWLEIRGTKNV